MPAGLVQILLLRAGIETNPGPTPGRGWICCVCNLEINEKIHASVRCNKCHNWCHFRKSKNNCSLLKNLGSKSQSKFICQKCNNESQVCDKKNKVKTPVCDKPTKPPSRASRPAAAAPPPAPPHPQLHPRHRQPQNRILKA